MIAKSFKHFDWLFFTAAIILSALGILMIYSTGLAGNREGADLWIKQLLALGIGLAGLFFLSNIDYHFFGKNSALFYVLALVLLGGLLFFAAEIRGSRRWFDFGFFNFQPSEFSKLALIISLAKYFQMRGNLVQKFSYAGRSFIYVLLPIVLIMLQPDLGSAAVHFAIWLGFLFVSSMPRRFFLYFLVIFLAASAVAWQFFLAPYQKDRLYAFLEPASDPLGRGYNVIQSTVAVGSGGLLGTGLARGLQSQLRFLPERQTDFIFAATSEELGLLGGGIIMVLLGFILLRIIRALRKSRDLLGMYLASGVFFLLLTQSAINIGMNLGLLPVTGITLPFLSYGGSSLIVTFWSVGIVESIARHSLPVRFG